jgi:hypothetical protein
MRSDARIGSAFRLIGFVFLVLAVVPAFQGEGVNMSLLATGLAFWIIGLVIGIRAKRSGS